MCDHKYVHMGLQYADGANNITGSGAKMRYYAHVFFCERCLDQRAEHLDIRDTSYQKPRDGAVPGDRKVIVPSCDMTYGYV